MYAIIKPKHLSICSTIVIMAYHWGKKIVKQYIVELIYECC